MKTFKWSLFFTLFMLMFFSCEKEETMRVQIRIKNVAWYPFSTELGIYDGVNNLNQYEVLDTNQTSQYQTFEILDGKYGGTSGTLHLRHYDGQTSTHGVFSIEEFLLLNDGGKYTVEVDVIHTSAVVRNIIRD